MENLSYIYTPFVTKRSGTERIIEGPVSANMVDLDGQLVDQDWLKRALPSWMSYGNIREQHNAQRPVGKALTLDLDNAIGPSITARISDDECWRKIEDGVFSGFSIGVKSPRIINDGRAPKGTIVGGEVMEVSVVDHPSVRKAAFTLVTKMAGGWKDIQSGATIAPEKETTMDPIEDTLNPDTAKGAEHDEDSFSCPQCSKDIRTCDCFMPETHKTPAPDFENEHDKPRPINPGHPDIKGEAKTVHAYGAQHEGPESQHAPLTAEDAQVRLDYTIRKVEHMVSRMENALDALNSAGFNPNEPTERTKTMPASDPNTEMGRLAPGKQDWHGELATHSNADRKSAGDADIVKIATDAARIAIDEFFQDNGGILTKGALAPDSTKAAFAEQVRHISSAVAYELFDQLEARVSQVEKMPMPSKGIAVAQEKHFRDLNPIERQLTEADITKGISVMSDDQRLVLAAQLISHDWAQGAQQQR